MASTTTVYPSAEDEEALLYAMHLATYPILPMTLRAAIKLGVFEAIARAGRDLSPTEVATQVGTSSNPDAPNMLDRILRLLASYSILTYSLRSNPDGSISRLYGLAPVCKYLTPDQKGVSLASLCLLCTDMAIIGSSYGLKDAVVDGGLPFSKAHDMMLFEYLGKEPHLHKLFNEAMSHHSAITMNKILDAYEGFRGLSTVVDVGGGLGTTLHTIRSKFPEIKGVNFDLPHVIQVAPALPGVTHIAGDMFESVPNGNAILMKWILHDWTDVQCLNLLNNCHKSLSDNGKVIVVEAILPEAPESNLASKIMSHLDMFMLSNTPGGKERTRDEFECLAKAAGFSQFKVACCAVGTYVMEFIK